MGDLEFKQFGAEVQTKRAELLRESRVYRLSRSAVLVEEVFYPVHVECPRRGRLGEDLCQDASVSRGLIEGEKLIRSFSLCGGRHSSNLRR